MASHKEYLATRVLSDSLPVTYRLLSRELKVHVHAAKQMLLDFWTTENTKKTKSVHATYIVSGLKELDHISESTNGHDEDIKMEGDSSKYIKTVSLVKEEDLEALKLSYQSITSVHIYSLQPNSPQDLHQLTTISQELGLKAVKSITIQEEYAACGSITNPSVRRRKNAKPTDLAAAAIMASKASVTSASAINKKPNLKSEAPAAAPTTSTKDTSGKSKTSAPPTKGNALFSAFSKTKPKDQNKSTVKSASKAAETAKSEKEDTVMEDAFSDDDDYEEDMSALDQIAPPTKKAVANPSVKPPVDDKGRVEREAKLNSIWDEDDTEMKEDVADSPAVDNEPISNTQSPQSAENEIEDGTTKKRRGRRRVMKKKTYTDDDGYLVTKEEPEWESFSEEDPQVKKSKPQPASAGKKKAPAKGQGNIMSFFGKK